MKRAAYFDVRPRYTSGSPAMVDEFTARRVLSQEIGAHAAHAEGWYGDEGKAEAEQKGLSGIVEFKIEHGKGWVVYDLITGAWRIRRSNQGPLEPCPLDLKFRYARMYNLPGLPKGDE